MIAQAVGHGVSQERIAAVRGIDGRTVKTKIRLLTGICSDAAALLADRNFPTATYETLKSMKLATPPEQLVPAPASRGGEEAAAREQIDRLGREIVSLQAKVTDVEDRYGVDDLHLSVSISYANSLLNNRHVCE